MVGLDGALVEVEADIGSGLPAVTVIGVVNPKVAVSGVLHALIRMINFGMALGQGPFYVELVPTSPSQPLK